MLSRSQLSLFQRLRFSCACQSSLHSISNPSRTPNANPEPRTSKIMSPLNPTSQVCVTCSLPLPERTACPVEFRNLLCPFCHAYYSVSLFPPAFPFPLSPLATGCLRLPCFFSFFATIIPGCVMGSVSAIWAFEFRLQVLRALDGTLFELGRRWNILFYSLLCCLRQCSSRSSRDLAVPIPFSPWMDIPMLRHNPSIERKKERKNGLMFTYT